MRGLSAISLLVIGLLLLPYSQSTVNFVSQRLSFFDADAHCSENFGSNYTLATLFAEATFDESLKNLESNDDTKLAWIGLVKAQNSFEWISGWPSVAFQLEDEAHPCIAISDKKTLVTKNCDDKLPFFCNSIPSHIDSAPTIHQTYACPAGFVSFYRHCFKLFGVNSPFGTEELSNKPSCVYMNAQTEDHNFGKWDSDDCSLKLPFICQLNAVYGNQSEASSSLLSKGGCQDAFYEFNNACYHVSYGAKNDFSGFERSQATQFDSATQYCQNLAANSTLGVMHSRSESAFLRLLTSHFGPSSPKNSIVYPLVWIGLKYDVGHHLKVSCCV
ncbi:hypothetical protein Ciccas_000048 [Cichlidogyrus casuarinus]|uniref:C-type lectin domain-containing protein n=1 Tax=Cichlidogyrus casuarinus TaxID=1844966 RepID=A0ABD2QQ82_9PLAT